MTSPQSQRAFLIYNAGEHSAEINTADFPAGIYVLTLEAEGQVFSQTVVIER